MPEVNRYRVVLYGSSAEKPTLKAKIELYAQPPSMPRERATAATSSTTVGKIKFHEGLPHLPADREEKGVAEMNLPASMLPVVVDILRNEAPVYFAFHEGRAVFGTGVEPVGTRDESVPQLVRDGSEARPVPPSPTA
jgi:hypothetical protein